MKKENLSNKTFVVTVHEQKWHFNVIFVITVVLTSLT